MKSPAAPPDADTAGPMRRRRLRPVHVAFGLALVAALAGTYYVTAVAWPETAIHEAYLPQLEAMAARDPFDGPVLSVLGARLMEAHEFDGAADRFEHALGSESSSAVYLCLAASRAALADPKASAYLQIGAEKMDSHELRDAIERLAALPANASPFQKGAAISPSGAHPILDQYARGSFLNGFAEWLGRRNPEQSGFATRQDWVRTHPDDPEAQRLWGLALLKNRRYADSQATLMRAAELAPNDPEVVLGLGQAEDAVDEPAEAAIQYINCLKLKPRFLPALLGLGMDALQLQMPQSAIRVFQQATKIAPVSADAWIGLGRADMAGRRNYDAALTAFETAQHLAPSRKDFEDDVATALIQNNKWSEADSLLNAHLETNPQDPTALSLLASVYLDYNPTPQRLDDALSKLQKAIPLAPEAAAPALRLQLAILQTRTGHAAEAVASLERVVAEQPANQEALLSLSHAYRLVGQSAKSEAAAQRAATVAAASEQIKTLLAHSLANPTDIELHQQLAETYARVGLSDKAGEERRIIDVLKSGAGAGKPSGAQTLQSMIDGALSP